MVTQSTGELPIGATIEDKKPAPIPTKITYAGKFVKLHPVEPENDVDELFLNSYGSDEKERIWTYMAYGPYDGHGPAIPCLTCWAEPDNPSHRR